MLFVVLTISIVVIIVVSVSTRAKVRGKLIARKTVQLVVTNKMVNVEHSAFDRNVALFATGGIFLVLVTW